MFSRKLLLLVLLVAVSLPAHAQTENDGSLFSSHEERGSAAPTVVSLYGVDSLLARAYRDVFEMLSKPNRCSDF
jgi:hypothetical protein